MPPKAEPWEPGTVRWQLIQWAIMTGIPLSELLTWDPKDIATLATHFTDLSTRRLTDDQL